jgi:P27 family predicted phage terminase small subunit
MRGRKPKPTAIKLLEGNPGKRPLNGQEPITQVRVPDCPEFLDDEARAEWFRTVPVLRPMRLLTEADRSALAAYCTAYSRWVQAERQVRQYGAVVLSPNKKFPMKSPYLTVADQALETMRKLMVEFGLTPSARSRIRVPRDNEASSEFEVFLEASG